MEHLSQAIDLSSPGTIEAVTCPACGLLCDDLSVERHADGALKVVKNPCAKGVKFFQYIPKTTQARINGKPADLQAAIAKATEILGGAKHPLLSGLGTDIQGMRAVMNLAEKSGATIDHMNGKSSMRNLLVMQNSGWQITTLTEVKNRVDLLLVVGTDIVSYFSRFFERNIWNPESMFGQDTSSREVVYLGGRDLDTSHGVSPKGVKPTVLPCDVAQLPEVLGVLRAILLGKKVIATEVAGIQVADLAKLAERLQAAKYSVVAWTASALDFPHAELAIQNIVGIVDKLNATTRSSGLPLSGSEGDVGAYNTSSWISGYPFRMSYRNDYPDYEPHHYATDRLLAEGQVDAIVWISSFNPARLPPASKIANIVIGHPNLELETEPDIFIPVAVPGIETKGIQFRSDSSVALPLKQLRATDLPTLGDVLSAIEAGL
ncbi:formylmethanofuran dehydrogenase subunit B [Methylovorus menthalis]|uniref:formylmethanofuran dehydrogenase subunit B n=1 Tax=Methylovorus menthalis TaxID=1002227 RepID=UPI001E33B783|nr:formylmethanofuran dehydrogenase subunit B [Methylovorus menthalis]MCB4811601.1 formylmethanofuran dehydrogenase subunit B [Methylovorus menthalis]